MQKYNVKAGVKKKKKLKVEQQYSNSINTHTHIIFQRNIIDIIKAIFLTQSSLVIIFIPRK